MPRFHNPRFERVELSELLEVVSAYKRQGLQFVQICATTLEDSCDLLYAFIDPQATEPGMIGIITNVPDGTHVPSITECYPAAFVFENETHDLFGIEVDGINIDFGGEFYTVAVKYPMNPRAALREQEADDADDAPESEEEGTDE